MKINKDQSGVAHLLPILVIVVVIVVGFVGWKVATTKSSVTDKPRPAATKPAAEADIALQNIGLKSIDAVDVTTQATREFKTNQLKGFYVFGDSLSGGRLNPNFEFASLKPGTEVVSAIEGKVTFIRYQEDSKDYEVFVQPKDGSVWTIGYDHLTNLSVKKDQTVEVGQVLGQPAVQNNGLTRFEIQINKDLDGQTTHICPSTLLAADVKDQILKDLESMQASWEKTTGLELYNPSAQSPIGCIQKTLTVAQADGR